jgi:asparagine synthase (glutamine-hydrolysing)
MLVAHGHPGTRVARGGLSRESADEVFGGYAWYHVHALLAAPTFPWAADGSWAPLLTPSVRSEIRLDEYAADRHAQAVAEVPRLAGESPEDRRIREVLYLGLTRWLPFLLDRKDRLSMACGLEVRVPFTDHRLVEYVWNVPWAMKEAGGSRKDLLRTAAAGLLPTDLLNRRKSIYPGCGRPGLRAGGRRAAARPAAAAARRCLT